MNDINDLYKIIVDDLEAISDRHHCYYLLKSVNEEEIKKNLNNVIEAKRDFLLTKAFLHHLVTISVFSQRFYCDDFCNFLNNVATLDVYSLIGSILCKYIHDAYYGAFGFIPKVYESDITPREAIETFRYTFATPTRDIINIIFNYDNELAQGKVLDSDMSNYRNIFFIFGAYALFTNDLDYLKNKNEYVTKRYEINDRLKMLLGNEPGYLSCKSVPEYIELVKYIIENPNHKKLIIT